MRSDEQPGLPDFPNSAFTSLSKEFETEVAKIVSFPFHWLE